MNGDTTEKKGLLYKRKYRRYGLAILLAGVLLWLWHSYGPFNGLSVTNLPVEDHIVVTEVVDENEDGSSPVTPTSYQLAIEELPERTTDEFPMPRTELFLVALPTDSREPVSLGDFDGTCTVNTFINVYEPVASYIPDESAVIDQVSCWFAGAGSETYLYTTAEPSPAFEVVSFTTQECGDLPVEECSPYSEAEILISIP